MITEFLEDNQRSVVGREALLLRVADDVFRLALLLEDIESLQRVKPAEKVHFFSLGMGRDGNLRGPSNTGDHLLTRVGWERP